MKLPDKRVIPKLDLVDPKWRATCGRCMRRSRTVHAVNEEEAWNEIASAEGWCVYEYPPVSGVPSTPYPVCLRCTEIILSSPEERDRLRA